MGPRDEYHKFLSKVISILFFYLAVLHLDQLNRSDMLNARKIQEFVMFISRLFLRYPREAFCPLIYEYNISMVSTRCAIAVL